METSFFARQHIKLHTGGDRMIKKRALSLLLSFSMLLALLPGTALAAQVPGGLLGGGSPTGANDPVSYETKKGLKGTSPKIESGWQELTAAGGGTLTLRKDVTSSAVLTVPGGCQITLNLNGRTLSRGLQNQSPRDGGGVLTVAANGELIVKSTPPNGSSTPAARGAIMGGSSTTGGGVHVKRGGRLELQSGSIIENASASYGGGIFNEGTVVMSGGTVSNNKGGGVYQDGLFTVSGGAKVTGNETANVYLPAGKKLTADKVSGGAFGLFLASVPEAGKAVTAVTGSVSSTEGYTSDQNLIVSLEEGNIVLRSTEKPAEPGQFMQAMDGPSADESDFITQNQSQSAGGTANTYISSRAASIHFNLNYTGATDSIPDIEIPSDEKTYNELSGFPKSPKRVGYNFLGWFDRAAEDGATEIKATDKVKAEEHTLYAHWAAKEISVTLNENYTDATISIVEVEFGKTYADVFPTVDPVRTGYTFEGWYTSSVGGQKISASDTIDKAYNHTLYAIWKSNEADKTRHKITFYPKENPNTDPGFVIFTDETGDLIMPSPSKCGFAPPYEDKVFDQWSIGDGTTKVDKGDTHRFDGETDVFATWKEKGTDTYHKITYDLNGGEGNVPADEWLAENEKFTVCEDVPVKDGYRFDGWKDGTTEYTPGNEYTVGTNSITITAQWKKVYIISFEANGGGGTMDAMEAVEGEDFTFPECTFTEPTGPKQIFEAWTFTEGTSSVEKKPGDTHKFTADTVVTAKWKEPASITVTLNANGGQVNGKNTDTIIVTEGGTYGAGLVSATWDADHEFKGWFTQQTDGDKVESGDTVDVNITTLYAQWTPVAKSYTIKFAAGTDASGSMPDATVQKAETGDTSYTIPASKFTAPAGKVFKEWTVTAPTGNDAPTVSEYTLTIPEALSTTTEITLTATWEEPDTATQYVIQFEPGTGATGTMSSVAVDKKASGDTTYTIPEHSFEPNSGMEFKEWTVTAPTSDEVQTGEVPTVSGNELTIPAALAEGTTITLTAVWENEEVTPPEEKYTVKLNPGDGTGTPRTEKVPKVPSDVTHYSIPTYTELDFDAPTGKEFDKWTVTAPPGNDAPTVTGNTLTIPADFDITQEITLTATWKEKAVTPGEYSISFHKNGGSGEMDDMETKDGKLVLPACEFAPPNGKIFDKWAIGSASSTVFAAEGTEYTFTADTKVYALWKDVSGSGATVTISYDENGGSGSMSDSTALKGKNFNLPQCKFTPPKGKEFAGWEIDGKIYAEGAAYAFKEDTEVKATWKDAEQAAEKVQAIFKGGEGALPGADYSFTYDKGTEIALPYSMFNKSNFKFTGWFDDSTGSKELLKPNKRYKLERDTTFTAQWEAEAPTEYTVTFDVNTDNTAATVSPSSKNITPGKAYGDLPTPTWAGHDFLGWCAGENGKTDRGIEITKDTIVSERNDHRM